VLGVLFGVLAGACFGALAVTVRIALRTGADPEAGAAIAAATAFVISAALALAVWSSIRPGQLWAFALVGMLVPGLSQIVFVLAVRDAGPSRAAILIGTAPLISVLIALTLLGEPFHVALVAGTVLIVAGGATTAVVTAVLLYRVIGAWGLVPLGWALWLRIPNGPRAQLEAASA